MELTRVSSIHKLLIKNTENGTICIPDIFEPGSYVVIGLQFIFEL